MFLCQFLILGHRKWVKNMKTSAIWEDQALKGHFLLDFWMKDPSSIAWFHALLLLKCS